MMKQLLWTSSLLMIVALTLLVASCASRSGYSADDNMHKIELSEERFAADSGGMEAWGVARTSAQQFIPGETEPAFVIKDLNGLHELPHTADDANPRNGSSFSITDWLNPAAQAQESAAERYLIRTGSLTLEIEDFEIAKSEVERVADEVGGFIADTRMDKYGDGTRDGYLTLRIPNDVFFETFDALKQLGDVSSEVTSSEDVSGEYLSNISNLQNLMHEQEVLSDMLDDAREVLRSRGLGEAYDILLKTEERLSEVTGELQRIEDRVKYLSDQISLSTIIVNLSERPVYQADEWSWGIGSTFEGAKKDLAYVLRGISQGFIRFLVLGWLWFVPLLIVLWFLRRKWKKHITPRLRTKGLRANSQAPPAAGDG